jgi:hypothetical protein
MHCCGLLASNAPVDGLTAKTSQSSFLQLKLKRAYTVVADGFSAHGAEVEALAVFVSIDHKVKRVGVLLDRHAFGQKLRNLGLSGMQCLIKGFLIAGPAPNRK